MALLPRLTSKNGNSAADRYHAELEARPRNAKSEYVRRLVTIGQLLDDTGLGDFVLSLDNDAFSAATPEARRKMLETMLHTAAGILGGEAFGSTVSPAMTTTAPPAPAPALTPVEKQEAEPNNVRGFGSNIPLGR